jgi:hypothetical protein
VSSGSLVASSAMTCHGPVWQPDVCRASRGGLLGRLRRPGRCPGWGRASMAPTTEAPSSWRAPGGARHRQRGDAARGG